MNAIDLKFIILLIMANGGPIVASKLFASWMSFPIDAHRLFYDHQPIFGPTKTLRGIVASLIASVVFACLLGFGWQIGILVWFGAMGGDLLSSFIKRRLTMPSSSMALGLDQVPESLFPTLLCAQLLQFTFYDIALICIIFFVLELVLSRALYKFKWRDKPY